MIVDEPTAGLDLAASSGLLKTITELNREHGITVIFVTHDLQMAGRHASHVAIFKNRRIQCGAVADVLTGKIWRMPSVCRLKSGPSLPESCLFGPR